jgi:predicted PhzF superfamily epimerase YddE/YHI9
MSGDLGTTYDKGWIVLDFPLRRPEVVEEPPSLATALGISPLEVWRHGDNLLALLSSGVEVRSLSPDSAAIKALPATGVIVTAPGDEVGVDFVSRYFAPAKGLVRIRLLARPTAFWRRSGRAAYTSVR